MRLVLARTLAACALAAAPTAAWAQTAGLVTRANVGALGAESSGGAGEAAVSADGRFVAFHSEAADLVPGDTNGDSDVFVRDRTTDVLQRVSVTSSGMEARGDSTCPSLSADGRYVAFLSRARSLTVGSPSASVRPKVYLHDRQTGSTMRLSNPPGGGEPDADSGCPSISGDGQRIVFASYASNFDSSDDDRALDVFLYDRARAAVELLTMGAEGAASAEPVISGNGRYVAFVSNAVNLVSAGLPSPGAARLALTAPHIYVRDLVAGTTELVSVSAAGATIAPDGPSTSPSISDDGRYVAFRSFAANLVSSLDGEDGNVYVRDRTKRTTWIASVSDPLERDCGRDGISFPCRTGVKGPPAISGDGRFVAFSSRSLRHLPANAYSGDQIYLFDNLGRRLRRLSVDPTGVSGEACSWEPALSADGRVLAWASKSANLVPDDAGVDVDVFAQERSCDREGVCRPLAACPAQPLDCTAAESSLLRLRKHPAGGVREDDLYWRWSGAATGAAFPDPSGAASYQACVYADGLALDVAAPQAARCDSAARPCWRAFGSGYKLLDAAGGLTAMTLSRGPETRRIHVRGGGALLDAPYLPLDGSKGIVVQLHETGSRRCWGATFPASSISRNFAGVPGVASRRDGLLVAEIR